MPPRKRTAKTPVATAPKKLTKKDLKKAEEQDDDNETEVNEESSKKEPVKNSIAEKLKAADKQSLVTKTYSVDKFMPNADNYQVFKDYDCMLNRTDIGDNNNKFYVIQLLKRFDGLYQTWTRWGRVGERGQNAISSALANVDQAIKDFEKKFKDKTKNNWADRANFQVASGKYTLLEMDSSADTDCADPLNNSTVSKSTQASKLDATTQNLIKLIYDTDMFKNAMKQFDIDVKKMPLGKLSKTQIAKGFEVLEEIEAELKKAKPSNKILMDLSSKFYTVIPQDFGRQRPPTISETETLQKKYDMLIVLSDIELAQSMQETKKEKEEDTEKPPHPIDVNYDLLKCQLTLLDKNSNEFKIIETYTQNTNQNAWRKCEIMDVWKVERADEEKRFALHENIDNRKLLWHGTNVAVVVAILKTGLRIMPHSGGRVGKGIYFASENSKSAGYVGTTNENGNNVGIMFLNEVALGNEHHIFADNSSIVKPPDGFDCVIAKGNTEPDPIKDTYLLMDGKKVVVPQGNPIRYSHNSSFAQSEYLVYNESQNRIRFLLKVKF